MFRNLKNESIHIKNGEAIFYSTKLFRHLKWRLAREMQISLAKHSL